MQHPEGYELVNGKLQIAHFWQFVLSPWAIWAFLHNMSGAVITGAFVVAGIGAFWTLQGRAKEGAPSLRMGVVAGLIACCLQLFPTGDRQGKLIAEHQPATLAAMEGVFRAEKFAKLAIIGQPDVAGQRLENPIVVPGLLSFLAYGSFGSTVQGLTDFPRDEWPDNIDRSSFSSWWGARSSMARRRRDERPLVRARRDDVRGLHGSRRIRLRRRRAAPLRRAHGSRTARRARGHRPRLGRQRGVAHRRRLHALRSARPRLCGRRSTASCSPGRGRGRSRSSRWPA